MGNHTCIIFRSAVIVITKNRKTKELLYQEKYKGIPINFNERLNWMCDTYSLPSWKMEDILLKRDNILSNLQIYQYNILQLLEEPEGSIRPRFRLVNRKNFNVQAISNSNFVHVYTPNAKDDYLYMKKLVDDELVHLSCFINTPCIIDYTAYFKTPSSFDVTDTFLSEIGLIRPTIDKPDWDNIGKKYCDMYNHNIWLDDALVIDGSVHKYYSILPRVEIKLSYMNTLYNKKAYDKIVNRKDYDENTSMPISYLDKKGTVITHG